MPDRSQTAIRQGPGWSWICVRWPWQERLTFEGNFDHKAVPHGDEWADGALEWTVQSTAAEACADLERHLSGATPHVGCHDLAWLLRNQARDGELVLSYTARPVPQIGEPPYAPAFVYCIYEVPRGEEAHRAGMRFFTRWRTTVSGQVPPRAVPREGPRMW
jgi:hypothetical protein